VKRCHRESKVWAAPIVLLCELSCTIGAYARSDSSPQLSVSEIQPLPPSPFALLVGAALSPDGKQVAAAYFDHVVSPSFSTGIGLSVRIWNVGTQDSVASKQLEPSDPPNHQDSSCSDLSLYTPPMLERFCAVLQQWLRNYGRCPPRCSLLFECADAGSIACHDHERRRVYGFSV
jgi:hypothetical protein